MGLLPANIALLAREQHNQIIEGSVLTLGQPAVWTTLEDVERILHSQGITPRPLGDDFDRTSKVNRTHPLWKSRTNAQAVLTALGATKVWVADCSAYESPDLLLDLNQPVSTDYLEKFDTILDCGTLEHVFNLPVALSNLKLMLKKGGHVILINPSSGAIDHSFYAINPTLYFDYFKANGFADLRCYLCQTNDETRLASGFPHQKTTVFEYTSGPQFAVDYQIEMFFCARKLDDSDSLSSVTPMQSALVQDVAWSEGVGEVSAAATRPQRAGFGKMLKSLLPLHWKISALLALSMIRRRKRPPHHLRRLGEVKCSANPVTFDVRTSVRFGRRD